MPRASRRPRALRAVLGLAVLLALGFAVDMLVLVRARVRADGSAAIGGQAQAVPTAVAEAIGTPSSVRSHTKSLELRKTNSDRRDCHRCADCRKRLVPADPTPGRWR